MPRSCPLPDPPAGCARTGHSRCCAPVRLPFPRCWPKVFEPRSPGLTAALVALLLLAVEPVERHRGGPRLFCRAEWLGGERLEVLSKLCVGSAEQLQVGGSQLSGFYREAVPPHRPPEQPVRHRPGWSP